MRREKADTELDIIFLVFCCSFRTCLLGFCLHIFAAGEDPHSRSSLKMGAIIFGRLHIVAPSVELTFFSCFLSRVHSHGSFSQSEFVTDLLLIHFIFISGVRCYFVLELGNLEVLLGNN